MSLQKQHQVLNPLNHNRNSKKVIFEQTQDRSDCLSHADRGRKSVSGIGKSKGTEGGRMLGLCEEQQRAWCGWSRVRHGESSGDEVRGKRMVPDGVGPRSW